MCQEMEFCQLQNCPLGSNCQNLDNGYECIANTTFDGHNMSLNYYFHAASSFNTEQLDTISITYRSRTGKTTHGSVTDRLISAAFCTCMMGKYIVLLFASNPLLHVTQQNYFFYGASAHFRAMASPTFFLRSSLPLAAAF
jgi:hypothetical protein